ncbi:peroxin4 [Prunus dulcis]|uniref:E2 ubiquitin-conjugating enzyme n=1 Tax=Prunus dulcis TaxID=3755 RepID=A0A4Y1QU46_PRUDU|nr:peroxin4 [Prunus dulcis]
MSSAIDLKFGEEVDGEASWNGASRARLFKEYKEVQREKVADPDIQLVCDDSNIFKWTALIKGPSETPFEGGVFQLAFAVPEQYPLQPPQVRFLTKIFHPNVHFKTGEICLDILKNAWSPAWTLQSVCRAIIALMAHPEPDSPLNCDSAHLSGAIHSKSQQSSINFYLYQATQQEFLFAIPSGNLLRSGDLRGTIPWQECTLSLPPCPRKAELTQAHFF